MNKCLRGVQQRIKDIRGVFGDDPDPSVVTVRFGFGEVSYMHTRGLREVNEDKGLTKYQRRQREKGQLRTAMSFKRTCRCNAHDAMR